MQQESFFETKGGAFSLAINKDLNKDPKNPLYFDMKIFDTFDKGINEIIKKQLSYNASFFVTDINQSGRRGKDNYKASLYIFLDVDSPECTIEMVINRLKERGYYACILPTKSHQKLKNGILCDRFRIIFPLDEIIDSTTKYKMLCRKLSQEICDGKDDKHCHDASRFFYSSPINTKPIYIEGKEGVKIEISSKYELEDIEEEELQDKNITQKDIRKYWDFSGIQIFDVLNKHFVEIGLKYKVAWFNKSNQTFNLYRDDKDKNPGCFIYANSNIIHDNNGKKIPIFYSPAQLIEAKEDNSNLELERDSRFESIKEKLNQNKHKDYNIILSSEGLGKSLLVPKYKYIYGVDRVILLCKSYEQLDNKQKMFKEKFPKLKTVIIKGGEKLLRDYTISEGEWEYNPPDLETGEIYINLKRTIENSSISPEKKRVALDEIYYYEKITNREIKDIDIILMVEEKLRTEVLIKHNFCDNNELIIWDEFHFESWIKDRVVQDKDFRVKSNMLKIFEQETWNEHFKVKMIESKNWDWRKLLTGKKIVLTTENIVNIFFKKKFLSEQFNIIDERVTFKINNVHLWSVAPTLMRKTNGNKEKLATGLRLNGFTVMGNGINSKINNVTMKGQNYHDRFTNEEELVLLLTQPAPEEIASLMRNLDLSSEEATLEIMRANINQYIGRCNGFRNNLKIKSFNILIPNNLFNDILIESRYICPIKKVRDKSKKENAFNLNSHPKIEKIIYTLEVHYKIRTIINKKLFLSSFIDKVKYFIDNIHIELQKKITTMRNFLFYKEKKLTTFNKKRDLLNTYCPHVIYREIKNNKNKSDVLRDWTQTEQNLVFS